MADPYVTRRALWTERSNLPTRNLGRGLAQLPGLPGGVTEVVSEWLRCLFAGDVIRAAGSPMCGQGLLLSGAPGVGKTSLVCAILTEVLAQAPVTAPGVFYEAPSATRRPVYFDRYEHFLRTQKSLWADKGSVEDGLVISGALGDAPSNVINVLGIDDLGKEHATDWSDSMFENMLRTRYDRGLPTLITTNVPIQDWGNVYGASAGSFAYEGLIPVDMMKMSDRRRKR